MQTTKMESTSAEAKDARAHSEGMVSRAIENQTSKLPSDIWLWSAFSVMGISLYLHLNDRKEDSAFAGQWAAPLLLMGVYNKMVKIGGSDRLSQCEPQTLCE